VGRIPENLASVATERIEELPLSFRCDHLNQRQVRKCTINRGIHLQVLVKHQPSKSHRRHFLYQGIGPVLAQSPIRTRVEGLLSPQQVPELSSRLEPTRPLSVASITNGPGSRHQFQRAVDILLTCTTIRATVTTEVLLSIRYEYVDYILAGLKGWEFRRTSAPQPGSRVWMYATAPTAAVLGWFEVGRVVRMSSRSPHRQIAAEGYVTVRELRQYFAGLDQGVALEIMRPDRLARPVGLPRGESGPQTYRFITDRASDRALLRRLKAGM
jgi:predicted transcriptional regulator